MTNLSWQQAIQNELAHAQKARNNGKEGMARVCARRAAGHAIGEYLRQNNLPTPGPNAMDRLNYLGAQPDISPELKKSIKCLTQRVNENHELPVEVDLIRDARKLITALIPEFDEHPT